MRDLKQLRKIITEKQSLSRLLSESISGNTKLLQHQQNRLELLQKTRLLLQEVGQQTQQNLEYHISSMVTMALKAVSNKFPKLVMRFEMRRNQTECDLLFQDDNGNEYAPVFGAGGGALDIASFALRIAFWSLRKNHAVMVLDEPTKFLSDTLQENASKMIKEISKRLGLQFIIVSHREEIVVHADKVFDVSINKNVSKIIS